MMDKVYIVCGFSGQYEDYRTWNVEAHSTEEAANKRCEFLNNLVQSLPEIMGDTDVLDWEHFIKNHSEGDPNAYLCVIYKDASYCVKEVSFKG